MRELSAKLTEGEIQRANESHSTFSYYKEILSRLRRERINYISRQKDFAFCGARPKALPLETANFFSKSWIKSFQRLFPCYSTVSRLKKSDASLPSRKCSCVSPGFASSSLMSRNMPHKSPAQEMGTLRLRCAARPPPPKRCPRRRR